MSSLLPHVPCPVSDANEPRLCPVPADGPVFFCFVLLLPGWIWLGRNLLVLSKGGKPFFLLVGERIP